jgi:glucose/arabinose dehydrogenase
MQKILFEKKNYLIFSLSDIANDLDNSDPQLLDNFFGKINYINLENLESGIFSLGHRNPQGLSVNNNIILSTEHGPRGGDEINLIEKGKNYGWPVASYGKAYFTKDLTYKNSHNKYGYKEPIFSFLSAIGISELIKIPNSFFNNTDLENTYLISSLFGRSLFLTNFDEKFTKVTFIEKIYIGERIRDLIYLEKNKIVLLSLENPTRIGILK